MRTKAGFLVLAAIISFVMVFVARQRDLHRLRAGNESLRQDIEASRAPPAAPADEHPAAPPTPVATAQLSLPEHLELLRLRGQAQPLRGELQEMSNLLASAAQPQPAQLPYPLPVDAPITPEQRRELTDYQRHARRFGSALANYLGQHEGELPDDLGKLGTLTPALPEEFIQRFELIHTGKVHWGDVAIAREKAPRPLPAGLGKGRVRTTVYAAGHVDMSVVESK
jgi:hypothetical protein